MKALVIKDLCVEVAGRRILDKLNLSVPSGELHVLFGPNGAGKSVLVSTIAGYPQYKITGGFINLYGKDISKLSINERICAGLGLCEQRPPTVKGVSYRTLINAMAKTRGRDADEALAEYQALRPGEWLEREINEGLSGGESKACELALTTIQKPSCILLDEPDSGVDPVQLGRMARMIEGMLGRLCLHCGKTIDQQGNHYCVVNGTWYQTPRKTTAGILVTHSAGILQHMRVDRAHLLLDGAIRCSGEAAHMLETIREKGFDFCRECQHHKGVINV